MVPSAPLSSRVADLLEALRTEYDSLTQESSAMKIYKDDYEQRINSQIAEMAMFQTGLADLEQRHLAMRKQYEDEINRLRREIQALGGAPVVSTPFISQPQQQPMLAQGQAMPISQAHNAGMPPGSQPHASQGPGGMYGMPAASGPHNGPNGPIMTPGQPPMGGESHPGAPYAMGPGGPYGPGGNVPMGAHGQQPPQQPPTPQQQAAGVAKDRKPNVMAQQQQQQQQAQQAQQQQMANRQTPTQSVRNVGPSGQKPPQQPPTPQQQQQAQQQQQPQQMQPQQGM
ncbi:general transcription repressor, partial [Linderina macrospora]